MIVDAFCSTSKPPIQEVITHGLRVQVSHRIPPELSLPDPQNEMENTLDSRSINCRVRSPQFSRWARAIRLGVERIHGKLLKLEVKVATATIQKYMRKASPQLREAAPFGQPPRFSIRDRDHRCGDAFARVAMGSHVEMLKMPFRAPKANSFCEWLTP